MTPTFRSSVAAVQRVDLLLAPPATSSVIFARLSARCPSGDPGEAEAGRICSRTNGVFRAADQLHDVVEAPADDVGERRQFSPWPSGRDAIADLDRPVEAAAEPPGRTFMIVT